MAGINFNIAALPVVQHSVRLQTMHRSAFPVAVRNTLTRAAIGVKVGEMPQQAARTFTQRQRTFFKANSRFEKATGYDVNTMVAKVGFANLKPKVTKDYAVQDLEQQEHGGLIDKKAYIATDIARNANSRARMVRNAFRTTNIMNQVFDSRSTNLHGAKNDKEKYVLSSLYAKKGGFVLGNIPLKNGAIGLYQIQSVTRVKKTRKTKAGRVFKSGNTVVKSKLIYSVKKGRRTRVKATHFMQRASDRSAAKMNKYFIEEANKQYSRTR